MVMSRVEMRKRRIRELLMSHRFGEFGRRRMCMDLPCFYGSFPIDAMYSERTPTKVIEEDEDLST